MKIAGLRAGGSRTGLVLAVCCVAQFMVILDLSIVNVALPSIQSSLRFSAADLAWVIDAYAILFAGFLMLAGRAADLFGQRRTFAVALALFALASLAGGIAPSSGALIAARAGQGLAGAGMAAASLAIIMSTFDAGPARARAIGLWGAMNGAGGAAGMLFGGVITDTVGWRWVLLINVPIGIAAAVAATILVTDRRARERSGFDLAGALTLTAGLLIVTYGGVTAGSDGFGSAAALIPVGVGSVLLCLFGLIEARASDPLVPPGTLTPRLRGINTIVLLFSAAIFPMWFASSLYLQQVLSLSPLETGLTFVPMALAIFACASQAGKLVTRAGVRPVLGGGLIMMATGLLLFARMQPGGSAVQYVMLPGLLTAMGIGFAIVPSTIAATQSAAPGQAGLTSGLVNTARQVGGGLGLAVLISIATQYTSHLIGDGNAVSQSLTDGFRLSYLVAAGLAALAAVLTFVVVPRSEAGQAMVGRRLVSGAGAFAVAFIAVGLAIPRSEAAPIGAFTTDGAYSFASAPRLHPPKLTLASAKPGRPPLPGYFMTANFLDLTEPPLVGQSGPLMLDDKLAPVWFRPLPTDVVAGNLQTQTYEGKPVLTWWQGDISPTGEINSGEVVVVDDHYRTVATLKGTDGWVITLHSLQIKDGVAWVTANKNIPADLSGVGGVSHGVLVDSALQSYDMKTGKLLSSWRASDHIPLTDSYTQPPPNGFPWDAYHINSVSLTADGRALVSMRNTWAGYMFERGSGRIVWQLGGKHSSFEIPAADRFEWQHDMQLDGDSTVRLFDNHCCEITGAGQTLPADRSSRGLKLKLNRAANTASAVAEYSHGTTFRSQYMGNTQVLPNGNVIVGWGQVPYMSEFTKSGKLLFDASMPVPNLSYRVYVQPWVGRPLDRPRAAARASGGKTTVYASWNGATEVARWRVLAATGAGAPKAIASKARSGFETPIAVRGGQTRFTLQALDAAGRVLGTSRPVGPQGTGG